MNNIDEYPPYCGPANLYLLNKIIPDRLIDDKINIAIACHIHDEMFAYDEKSWTNFHAANNIMFRNCFAIFESLQYRLTEKEKNQFILLMANYLMAIDTAGAAFYWL